MSERVERAAKRALLKEAFEAAVAALLASAKWSEYPKALDRATMLRTALREAGLKVAPMTAAELKKRALAARYEAVRFTAERTV